MKKWAKEHGVHIHYIQPGKPAQNAYIERFNRTYREEVLNMYLFKNIAEAQAITDTWMHEYNNERPHEALRNLTPRGYLERLVSTNALESVHLTVSPRSLLQPKLMRSSK